MGIMNAIKKSINMSNYSYVTEFKDGKAKAITQIAPYYIDQPYNPFMYNQMVMPYYLNQSIHIIDEDYNMISSTGLHCTETFWKGDAWERNVILASDGVKQYLLDKELDIVYEFEANEKIVFIADNKISASINQESRIYAFLNKKIFLTKKINGEIVQSNIYKGKYYYKFKIGNKYGIYNENFIKIIPCEYDFLGEIDSKGKISYQNGNKKGKMII